jgi:hypothetical protein
MTARPEDQHTQFSFWRAVRLLSSSLEALIVAGTLLKVVLALWFTLEDARRSMFEAAYSVVILSAVLFITIQIWTIFRDWRRGLFGFVRGIFYALVAGWGLLSAAV